MEGFLRVLTLTENLVPILLSFYLASWSDMYGRIPFIAVNITGRVTQTGGVQGPNYLYLRIACVYCMYIYVYIV